MIQLFTLLSIVGVAISVPQLGKWERIRDYPEWITEGQGGTIRIGRERHLMVCGGFYKFPGVTRRCYSRKISGSKSAAWVPMPPMPEAITHMAQAFRGHLFCGVGGFLGPHPGKSIPRAYCYSSRSKRWFRIPNIPGNRAGGGLVFWKGRGEPLRLIFAGGVDRPYNHNEVLIDYDTAWILNWKNKSEGWDRIADIPDGRNHMAAVTACGRRIWVGGQYKEDELRGNRATVNRYLPWKKRWVTLAPLPIPLGHISASTMSYACGIVVVGGMTNQRRKSKDIFWYSIRENKWRKIGQFPRVVSTPVCGIADGYILCATGYGTGPSSQAFRATISRK